MVVGRTEQAVVVGAGMGGLAAAIDLARAGVEVTLVERAKVPGGKMHEVEVAGARVDSGPTVLTMRWVLEDLFDAANTSLTSFVDLVSADVLARHAWDDRAQLDLYADPERTEDAIGTVCGSKAAKQFGSFRRQARAVYETFESSFIAKPRPSFLGLIRSAGVKNLQRARPMRTLWSELCRTFDDDRLRQLFGRYATYVGSSPFRAPATLVLIAHVEMLGVWLVRGGMQRLAEALAALATRMGVEIWYERCATDVLVEGGRAAGVELESGERLPADIVVLNADAASVASGRLGVSAARSVPHPARSTRSLSALTFAARVRTSGFDLSRHNVFFSENYAAEFSDVFKHARLPTEPTVYLCAQDRERGRAPAFTGPERLLGIVNAPPTGDTHPFDETEVQSCINRAFRVLNRCGLEIERTPETLKTTSPADFERRFPGTGGALYGAATHGPIASFLRPTSRTKMPGLYLAGGSVHPGAGVPMAVLSGRLAAVRVQEDLRSTSTWVPAAMSGGTLTP